MTLATRIAQNLFELGDEPNSPCRRIEFKGGTLTGPEKSQGGLNHDAFTLFLVRTIKKHLRTNHTDVDRLSIAESDAVDSHPLARFR